MYSKKDYIKTFFGKKFRIDNSILKRASGGDDENLYEFGDFCYEDDVDITWKNKKNKTFFVEYSYLDTFSLVNKGFWVLESGRFCLIEKKEK